ncbi:MAG TPA: sugar ABC transporter permease [Gemmatimonadaceae bacterium]|nr:sugar ABC transporter permease [Gemmatimonadaceae bacterium]
MTTASAVRAQVAAKTPEWRAGRAGWLFIAPAVVLIGVFFFLPVAASLLLSITDFDLYSIANPSNVRIVGARNYVDLMHNQTFWLALKNTFYFALVGGPLTVATSLGAALLLNAKVVRFKTFFRTIYFLPFVTTLVAVAIVWRYLYHPQYGFLNYALGAVGIHPIDWLGDPRWAMPAIILLAVWKNFGYNMLIFIAGLQAVPEDLYEAAALDGAGAVRQFWHVTLPNLAPTFVFVAVVTMIGYFQLFAEPYVMTTGGPLGATTSLVLFMYQEGFRWWRLGVAASIAFLLFIIILVWTAIQLRLEKRLAA